MTTSATWNTGSGTWFAASNWDEPNPNPPPDLLHYVPGSDNDVFLPDNSGIGTPFTVTYDGNSIINSLTSSRALTLDIAAGSLTIGNGGGTGVFLENGFFNVAVGATLTNNAGTLSFNGGTLAGTLAGSGTFRFINGTFDLDAGLDMTVANWLLTYQIGSGTVSTTNLNTDLTYAGSFTIDAPFGNPAILNLNGHTLTLAGTSALGGAVSGPGTIRILGDATLNGSSYTGGALLQIAKTATETGAASQAGGFSLAGTLQIDAGTSYTITTASSIASAGSANQAVILNNGTFSDAAVSATASRLDVAFTNTAGATLSIAAGATLKVGFSDFRGDTDSIYRGTISGGGTLWLGGNSSLGPATLTVGAILADDTTTIARNLNYAGSFTQAAFSTLELGGRTLTLSGVSDFTAGFNTIDGAGTLRITGSSTFGGFSVGSGDAATIRNSGAVTQIGGIILNNGSTLLNDANRTYTLAGGDITLTNSFFTNNGVLSVTAANTASHAISSGSFTNAGTLRVGDGATLQLGVSGGTATLGGTVTGLGASTLVLAGAVTVNTQIGTATLAANGTTTLGVDLDYAGAFSFGSFARINLGGHTLTLSGTAQLTGGFNTIDGAGTLKVTGASTFGGFSVGSTTAATVQNSGSVTQTGNIALNNGSTLLNDAGRTYTLAGGDITLTGSTFTNNGLLSVTAANTATHIISSGSFTNAGTLRIGDGATLQFGGTATLGGTVTGLGASTLALAGAVTVNTQIGTATLAANGTMTLGVDLDYAGAFSFGSFARINLAGHTLTLAGTSQLTAGFNTIDGTGTLRITGAATFSGFSAGATQAVTIRNSGTVTQTGTITLNNGSTLLNDAGHSYTVTGGNINSGPVSNAGTFIGNSGGTHLIATSFLNQGLIVVEQGSFVFTQLDSPGIIQGVVSTNGSQTTVTADAVGQLTLTGGSGNNRIVVDQAPTHVDGGAGTDTLVIAASMALLAGSLASIEKIEVADGVAADLTQIAAGQEVTLASLAGGGSTLVGTAAADSVRGGAGDDHVVLGAGDDTYDGGAGIDTVDYSAATADLRVALGLSGAQDIGGSEGQDSLVRVENVIGGAGNDTLGGNGAANALSGMAGNDSLNGGNGADTLSGGLGNDSLAGGAGADSMGGGAGNDTYSADDAGDLVTETSSGGDDGGLDLVRSTVGFTLGAFIENLTLLGAAAIDGTGNGLGNLIAGNAAANLLAGLDGADTLDGGAGADTLDGGAGDDVLVVESSGDVAIGGAGIDLVQSWIDYALGSQLEHLTLLGNVATAGNGNGLANRITGNNIANSLGGGNGADTLMGLGGNDTLNGGAGEDSLIGGAGADRYLVGAGDRILEQVGEGKDIVVAGLDWVLEANLETLALNGSGDFSGTGNELDNRMTGNGGANLLSGLEGRDVLLGGAGADTLLGGMGGDVLTGGADADWFRFDTPAEGGDRIADFVSGTDLIAISAAGFGGGLAPGALPEANFVARASGATTTPAGTPEFIYNTANGVLLFDADGIGGTAAVRIATLSGAPALTAADILVV